jgi:aspartate/methionine/tyrosine aminotransferase
VGALAGATGVRVLVDEVYLDMVDPPAGSACHLGEHFIITSSLTKAYGLSGLRCGWIIAEPRLARRIWRLNDLFGAMPVHPGELLSVAALDHLDEIGARAKHILVANRQALSAFFQCTDLAGFRSRWGTITFPALRHGSVEELCDLLRDRYETSVVPGHFFEMPQHLRIGIGGDPAMTAEGLGRLADALQVYGEGQP